MKVLILAIFFSFSSFALDINKRDGEIVFFSQVEKVEKTLPQSRKFTKYMDWAVTFEKFFKNEKRAIKFYKKAAAVKTSFNKMPALTRVVILSSSTGDYKTAKKYFKRLKSYAKKRKAAASQNFINLAQKYFFQLPQNAKKYFTNVQALKGSFKQNAMIHNYRASFLRKSYKKALKNIDISSAKKNKNFEMQVEYDVLKLLTNKRHKNLACKDLLYAAEELVLVNHTHMTCAILVDYVKNKKVSEVKFEYLKNTIKNRFPERAYLISAIKELKK